MIRSREDEQGYNIEQNNNAEELSIQAAISDFTPCVLFERELPEKTSSDLPENNTSNNVHDSCVQTTPSQTWSQTEPEEKKISMASPASPVKKKFADATYGVLRRRAKVAKGVQTDRVRKRCWRHSRDSTPPTCDPNGNEGSPLARDEDSRTEVPLSSFASMSTLRSALPSVNFPRWNRGNKKPCVVETLTERYLASLYRPYTSVKKQLTEQALLRSQTVGQELFEAHFLGPTALFLRTVKDVENNSNFSYYRKFRKGRGRHRKKKLPPGWPLCSRGLLIVHLADPDPSILKSGDFYFLATPVGIAIKWVERSSDPICERSLDAREFCCEMSTLASAGSTTEDDDEDNEIRRSLLVASEGGVQRVEVGKLLDELLECGRYRSRVKNTRDSWVQTEKDLSKSATTTNSVAEETKSEEVLQPLAPLASEEEFCSDSEQKQKPISVDDGFVEGEIPVPQRSNSPVVEVRQLSAIADIDQDVFNSQVAVMPGSRDICSRSILYITLEKIPLHSVNAVQLAELLLYFQSLPKRETMCLGFLAIVDGREASSEDWSILHKALALVEECVPGTVSLVLALHRQSQKSELLSSRFPIFHIKFEPIVNDNQLLRYVVKDQLLPSFGGTYQYDHESWKKFHEFLDPFIVSCHQTGCRIVKLIQDMRGGQLPSALSNHLIEQQKRQILEVLENEQLKFLEENGSKFLSQVENYKKDFDNSPDYEEAVEKSKMLYKQLKKVVQRLARLADKRLNKLQECMMMKVFEEESSQVLAWLRRKGEETLKRHKTLAETLNAIREQENEFEKFYFLAMQQIERGNDLLEEIPKHKNSEDENEISAHLRRQLDDFTDRLEDAREKLEDTSRCYHLLDKVYEWALETMRYVSHMKVDSTTSIHTLSTLLKRLDTYLQTHPYLEDEVFEEMVNLASKLGNERLLNQCQTSKMKYQETVDLVQARCETLQKAKEQMVCDERLNLNESLDDLKIKPCLWNPLAPSTPHRTISQNFLNGLNSPNGFQILQRESLGSYTAFPSNYYPSPSFKERLMNLSQKKSRFDYFSKRGSLTDDVVMSREGSVKNGDVMPSNNLRGRKSFPFSSTDSVNNLNSDTLKSTSLFQHAISAQESRFFENRNWKVFEEELKKYHEEVREQNHLLKQQSLGQNENFNGKMNSSKEERVSFGTSFSSPCYSVTNTEEFQKPALVNSHLMRCASCSDFEELLSSKSTDLDPSKNKINNRTLKLIMMEMIQTERDYVKSLGYIIENYIPLLQSNDVSQMLRSQRNVIFGNIEKIYEFHNCYFLRELEQCEAMPYNVGECFLKYETQFYLYALYNKNKPKSDALMAEYGNSFFKKKQQELGDKMDLASYLLKPVQRMGKYALLLKQLLKECPETSSDFYNNLKAAEEMVCFQLRHGNDLLAMDALRECDVNIKEQGRLLRQDEFLVWQGKSRKALRHVFLFEDLIIFSKARRDPECKGHDYYQYKNSIKTSDMGLTAQVGESPTKFEIWFRKCKAQDLYVLQAPSAEVKNAWVGEVTSLLWKQAERNRKLRLQEMSSMGIGNKPCLDITPSRDQICDRSISLQQLNKVPRFRNSIAVSSSDNFNNNELRRRPLSIISLGGSSSSGECHGSATFYDTSDPLVEVEEQVETDKRRSMAQQSQCSAESGIFTDLSTSGDSYVENVQRLKTVERSDSVISHTSYTSVEAINNHPAHEEISTVISSSPGVEV